MKRVAGRGGERRAVGLCVMTTGVYALYEELLVVEAANETQHHIAALRKGPVVQVNPWECTTPEMMERAMHLGSIIAAIKPLYETLMCEAEKLKETAEKAITDGA